MESLPQPGPQPNVPVTTGMRARVRGLTSDIGKTLNGLIVTVMEEAVYPTSHNQQEHRFTVMIDKEDLPRLPATTVNILTPLKHPGYAPGTAKQMTKEQFKEFSDLIDARKCVRIKSENLETVSSLNRLSECMQSPYVIQHSCRTCGVSGVTQKLNFCSKCKVVRYCSRECQRTDYPRHKKEECKALKKERKKPGPTLGSTPKSEYVKKFTRLYSEICGSTVMHSIDNLIRKAMPCLEFHQRQLKNNGTPAFYIADLYENNLLILKNITRDRHIVAGELLEISCNIGYTIGNSIRGDQPVEIIMFRDGSLEILAKCINAIGNKISLGEIKLGKDPMIIPNAFATEAGYMPLKIIPCDAKLKYEAYKEIGFQHKIWIAVGLMNTDYTLVHVVCPDLNGKFPGDPGCCMKRFDYIPKKYLKGRGSTSGSVKKAKKKFAKEMAWDIQQQMKEEAK